MSLSNKSQGPIAYVLGVAAWYKAVLHGGHAGGGGVAMAISA